MTKKRQCSSSRSVLFSIVVAAVMLAAPLTMLFAPNDVENVNAAGSGLGSGIGYNAAAEVMPDIPEITYREYTGTHEEAFRMDGNIIYLNGNDAKMIAGSSGTTIQYYSVSGWTDSDIVDEDLSVHTIIGTKNNTGSGKTQSILLAGGNVKEIYGAYVDEDVALEPADINITLESGTVNSIYAAYHKPKTAIGGVTPTIDEPADMAGTVNLIMSGADVKATQPTHSFAFVKEYNVYATGGDIGEIRTGGSNGQVGSVSVHIDGADVRYISSIRTIIGSLSTMIHSGSVEYVAIMTDTEGVENGIGGANTAYLDITSFMEGKGIAGEPQVNFYVAESAVADNIIMGSGISDDHKRYDSTPVGPRANVTIDARGKDIIMTKFFVTDGHPYVDYDVMLGGNGQGTFDPNMYDDTTGIYKGVSDYKIESTMTVVAGNLVIPSNFIDGYGAGKVTISSGGKIVLDEGAEITVGEGSVISGAVVSGKDSVTFDGIEAGAGGISITRGSLIINGVISTGNIVVDGDAIVSGTLESGVTLEVSGNLTVPEGGTLKVDNGATLELGESMDVFGTLNLDNTADVKGGAGTVIYVYDGAAFEKAADVTLEVESGLKAQFTFSIGNETEITRSSDGRVVMPSGFSGNIEWKDIDGTLIDLTKSDYAGTYAFYGTIVDSPDDDKWWIIAAVFIIAAAALIAAVLLMKRKQ